MQISSGFINTYFNQVHGALSPVVGASSALLTPLSLLASLLIFVIVLSVIFSIFSYVFGWVERKIMARAHTRHGPTYVGKYGFLQNLADLIKLLTKENIIPDNADKPIFQSIIPMMLASFVFILAFIPLTSTFIGIQTSLGLILVFMVLSFMPLLVFLSGWTSGNKFSSIAAQRSVIMLLSYEIPLVLVIVSIALLANSYSFTDIVNSQSPWWFVALMPIGFIVFFITMVA
jgi:NADH-quinone oxidoreductase subunit H